MSLNFTIIKSDSNTSARTGVLHTAHGEVPTPVFAPVGSQATVKTLTPEDLRTLNIPLILCNTYHLYLRPGVEVITKFGGLHRFMAWDGAILTDSGGYQLFSLASLARVTDEGVLFRSHIDGSEHFLSPEKAIELEQQMGADIIMAFDQPPRYGDSYAKVHEVTERTHRWAQRCRQAHKDSSQALFGISQGGVFPELRRESASAIASLGFDGYAVGGLSLGEEKELTYAMARESISCFPPDKPRYLMGVGAPEDLLEAVALGIDIFDSALATRVARNGALFTRSGRKNIRHSSHKLQDAPIEPACHCYTCKNFSAAYLHHLFRCEELLAYRLATIHNLWFIMDLMEGIRKSIADGRFGLFKKEFLSGYKVTDQDARVSQKRKWLDRRLKQDQQSEDSQV